MRRCLLILMGFIAAGLMTFAISWQVALRICADRAESHTDELAWLQQEFGLSGAELARVRELHDAYLPQCREYCQEIALGKARLEALLAQGDLSSPAVETNLQEIALWRARCQAGMLRHFEATARAMPPEQGARYLAVLTELTLGAHEQVEARMATDEAERAPKAHVHPH